MTWLQRYRIKTFLRNSVWFPPLLGVFAALSIYNFVGYVGGHFGWTAVLGPEGARSLLSTLAASILTFIVFVFSILLVAVQLASAQLTPRIIAIIYQDRVIRFSLSIFVFAFTFTIDALGHIEGSVPELTAWIAAYACLACICIFLYMIDYVGKGLRPVSILTQVGSRGEKVIESVYPRQIATATEDVPTHIARAPEGVAARTVVSVQAGVVLAFDPMGLVALAQRNDSVIDFVPLVGAFVARGDPLFRIYGGTGIADHDLREAVAIGPERTMEQDPEFAFRIIVDVAAKALSPAINDPTTGVLALDQLHHLLRTVGLRHLDTGRVHDKAGRLRLTYRTPDWENFVGLAVTEIRHFGKDSIQIARRLRAMLENLIEVVPSARAARLREELDLLRRAVDRGFLDAEDRTMAGGADPLGVGGAR